MFGVNNEILEYSKLFLSFKDINKLRRFENAFKHWKILYEKCDNGTLKKSDCWLLVPDVLSNTDLRLFDKRQHKIRKNIKKYASNKIEYIGGKAREIINGKSYKYIR